MPVKNVPADRMRLHICWGNYEGPHHLDVPLREILGEVLLAKPMAISFEAANPRHEHEYALFADVQLPPDKVIIPGVLDSTTNYIEHPELVAQRVCDDLLSCRGRHHRPSANLVNTFRQSFATFSSVVRH